MLPGETIRSGAPAMCEDCGTQLVPAMLRSAAGYYIGTASPCGPNSRESSYFSSREAAEAALPAFLQEDEIPSEARTATFVPSPLEVYVGNEALSKILDIPEPE